MFKAVFDLESLNQTDNVDQGYFIFQLDLCRAFGPIY
jgi:hypothetical protein